jgi:SAM-dependent methyltransferase
LEVGSYDVNGSVRQSFPNCDYVGVDLCDGPGVDLVCSGHEIAFPDATFDISISCECFEHNPHWIATFFNMHRMTKAGGLVVITCASKGRLEHGTMRAASYGSPGTQSVGIDYYRNLAEKDFRKAADLDNLFSAYRFFYISTNKDLYFIGWKRGTSKFTGDIDAFSFEVAAINKLAKSRLKVFDVPVKIAGRLDIDDRTFQNFAYAYLKAVKPIRSFFKSISTKRK